MRKHTDVTRADPTLAEWAARLDGDNPSVREPVAVLTDASPVRGREPQKTWPRLIMERLATWWKTPYMDVGRPGPRTRRVTESAACAGGNAEPSVLGACRVCHRVVAIRGGKVVRHGFTRTRVRP